MELPRNLTDKVRAVVVAISESGHAVMAIVAEGTTTPPMPKLAIVARATASPEVLGFTEAILPVKAAVQA